MTTVFQEFILESEKKLLIKKLQNFITEILKEKYGYLLQNYHNSIDEKFLYPIDKAQIKMRQIIKGNIDYAHNTIKNMYHYLEKTYNESEIKEFEIFFNAQPRANEPTEDKNEGASIILKGLITGNIDISDWTVFDRTIRTIEEEISLINLFNYRANEYKNKYKNIKDILKDKQSENEKIIEEGLKYLEQVEKLQEHVDKLQKELNTAQENLSLFTLGVSQQKTQYVKKSNISNKNIAELLKKIIRNKLLSPVECLELIEFCYSDKVEILPDAWKSAEEIDKTFQNGEKLLDLLVRLLTDYLDKYITNGDNVARTVFTNNEYAAQDNDSEMAKRGFPQHLKIGVAHNQKLTARVHFKVDRIKDDEYKITIAHCGKHLD